MGKNVDLKNNFGKKLAYLRKKKNLSQIRLAEMIDSNFNYISQIECGKANITMNMLILLSDAKTAASSLLILSSFVVFLSVFFSIF